MKKMHFIDMSSYIIWGWIYLNSGASGKLSLRWSRIYDDTTCGNTDSLILGLLYPLHVKFAYSFCLLTLQRAFRSFKRLSDNLETNYKEEKIIPEYRQYFIWAEVFNWLVHKLFPWYRFHMYRDSIANNLYKWHKLVLLKLNLVKGYEMQVCFMP